jgi:Holliday junction resolvase RusA-like endonuclease
LAGCGCLNRGGDVLTKLTIDLPVPPSVNAIWSHGRGRTWLNPKYVSWKRQADLEVMASRALSGHKTIEGLFRARIIVDPRKCRKGSDIDNKIKPVLDWAEKNLIVSNDMNCLKVTAEWGDAPMGCRLEIEPA